MSANREVMMEAESVGMASPGQSLHERANGPDVSSAEILGIARTVVADDARAIATMAGNIGPGFVDAVLLLSGCRGKVLVAGLGASGATARRIAHLLSVAGTPALFVHAADGLHGGLGAVSDGDVLIAVSKGGETDELNEYVRRAKQRGAQVIGMTRSRTVPLARLADVALEVVVPDDVDPGGLIGTGSSLATCALGDALAMATMRARGYTWSSFEFTHPGGAVGKLIQQREQGELLGNYSTNHLNEEGQ
jgi:D-arabinose 5-phosphate isomerase GutQ